MQFAVENICQLWNLGENSPHTPPCGATTEINLKSLNYLHTWQYLCKSKWMYPSRFPRIHPIQTVSILQWECAGLHDYTRLPDYTRDPIPPLNEASYPIRNRSVVGQIRARTERFKASFYPHCLLEWNKLDPEIRA